MHPPHPKYEHAYAIIRIDGFLKPVPNAECLTIKKVVWTPERALEEVNRLNKLVEGEDIHYRYQLTRVEKRDGDPATE